MAKTLHKKNHHHGNLREALIKAGIRLLRKEGLSRLTLRRCAAAVGVSHAAPAHHFGDMNGLLTAIAVRGFEALSKAMIEEPEGKPVDAYSRLEARCNGYLRFALENEALFLLMFSTEELNFDNPELEKQSHIAQAVLRDSCAPFKHGAAGSLGTEMMIWSLVHGFAGISLKRRTRPNDHPARGVSFKDLLPLLELRLK